MPPIYQASKLSYKRTHYYIEQGYRLQLIIKTVKINTKTQLKKTHKKLIDQIHQARGTYKAWIIIPSTLLWSPVPSSPLSLRSLIHPKEERKEGDHPLNSGAIFHYRLWYDSAVGYSVFVIQWEWVGPNCHASEWIPSEDKVSLFPVHSSSLRDRDNSCFIPHANN